MQTGNQGQAESDNVDRRRVYFELEEDAKAEEEEEEMSREDKYKTALPDAKGTTIKKAKVNVLQKAKMFEQELKFNPNPIKAHSPSYQTDQTRGEIPMGNPMVEEDEENIYDVATPIDVEEGQSVREENVGSEYMLATAHENFSSEYMLASAQENVSSEYMLASPVKSDSKSGSLSNMKSTNRGCQEGTGAAVPVDFIRPVSGQPNESSEYSRLYFQSISPEMTASQRENLISRGYTTFGSLHSNINQKSSGSEYSDVSDDDNTSVGWGSEFDEFSYQDCEEDLPEAEAKNVEWYTDLPEKPLPKKPGKGKPYQALIPKQLRSTSASDGLLQVDLSSSAVCLPVNIDPDKHPPPSLPSQPGGLTDEQKKRRCVIDLIISSEKSYLESLDRIIKQYEKPILEAISHPKAHVRVIFAVIREIISHHKMFSIELSECVRKWDEEEKIGDTFTASFSKTMVVNAYSVYVNNFSAAMEEIKSAQRNKQTFDEFLKRREKSNADRLSIFGLMVKPVQRFPQFIMCLQDLIKYMPQNHHDRRALQLALTELENVTHMLNERKRRSEQRFQALQTIHQLTRQKAKHMLTAWNLDTDSKRSLIRFDMVDEVSGEYGQMKCKNRRLILMNDLVLCVKVIEKEHGGFPVERLGLRWIAKLKDLELKDTAITPDMESVIKKEPGKIHIISSQLDNSENDPFHLYADLSEMLHDYTVLGQVSGLVATLKRSYAGHGLREELIHEISRDLQCMIQIKDEQLRLVNSCSIVLVDDSRSEKAHYVLQTQTAAIKQDWCVDFMMAKLAMNKKNTPAWDAPHASDDQHFDPLPAHFMKHLSVDVPRNYTKIRCAVSIYLAPVKTPFGVGVQHLWVCSSSPTRGQVSILSIHNSKPSLTESFSVCNSEILCVELVPGCGEETTPGRYLFVEDTVWMATSQRQILIFPLSNKDGVRRDPLATLETVSMVISIRFVDERIFCGHLNGSLNIFSRISDGAWDMLKPATLVLGTVMVQSHFVWEEDLWISCGNKIFVVEIDSIEAKVTHELQTDQMSSIDQIVKSGMGMWVSFHNSAVIKLFHLETLENLQEISIGNFLQRIASEKLWSSISSMLDSVVVTSLASSKGLLWIGTSLGVILTVPLPRLRSTLKSRPSRRNIERERIEFMESEKRHGNMTGIGAPEGDSKINTLPKNTLTVDAGDKKEGDKEGGNSKGKGKGKKAKEKKKQMEKKKSIDDMEVILRRRESNDLSLSQRKTQTLSFRSELANRIVVQSQRLSQSSMDLNVEHPLEVEMLYENLLDDDTAFDLEGKNRTIDKKMGDTSLLDSNSKELQKETTLSPSSTSSATSKPVNRSPTSASQSSGDSGSCVNNSTLPSKNAVSRSLTKNSTIRTGTVRKGTSCNAVIVLSGGDGYQDLDQSRSKSGGDDACVLLWIYKF